MTNTARKIDPSVAYQEFGTVVGADDGALLVRSSTGDYRVEKALGCLIEPLPGDRVLLALSSSGEAYVLSVLHREETVATTLAVPGDLSVRAATGKITVLAGEGIEIVTPREATVLAQGVSVHTRIGKLVVDQLSVIGTAVQSEFEQVKTVAVSVESSVQRLVERARDVYRFVSESVQLRAKHVDYVATDTARVHAKHTAVTADGLVKVDGDQIHIG